MNINKKGEKAILSVTNDLTTDQRVNKVALTLIKCGFTPILVGRELKKSLPLNKRAYKTVRLKLFFTKGSLFYAEYNIRLFFYLLFNKSKLLIANDLDTLLANYLTYRIKKIFEKKIKLIYDSHEFFTEVPELNGRLTVKKTWLHIEKTILPKIKYSYTVCKSIADEYNRKYNINMLIVRNIPLCDNKIEIKKNAIVFDNKHTHKKIILYQGALNIGRGIEHVILAMEYINNAVFVIIGDGDITDKLKNIVKNNNLGGKVFFTGKIPFNCLPAYTKKADIGIVLQEDLSLSYRYVLPNRLFNYIHAELPIIASDLPEMRKILSADEIGLLVSDLSPKNLANKIDFLLNNTQKRKQIKANLKSIKKKYCWEKEEKKLIELFGGFNYYGK